MAKETLKKNGGFNFFKNFSYALQGLAEVVKNETSFRVEIVVFLIFQAGVFIAPLSFIHTALMSTSLFIPIVAELGNSAVERTVDLVTQDYHDLAKKAKDAASAMVFMSIVLTTVIWIWVLADIVINS
ncbi:diacylglycerol kinase [Limisalsivibrio acetivorans]|uniref:diacylglycerol kinase n=1 Tax=Limisalsivibrio acetivorans TaxID=1304888 RepID=UPI0003B718A3|nr:diacylglycerol kinase [Limisalsivibrio acetivorans]